MKRLVVAFPALEGVASLALCPNERAHAPGI
jgi:hypothetical protein